MSQLRLRPFRRNDARFIKEWCKDEVSFYKWSAGILGNYPLSDERMLDATSGRDDKEGYFPFTAFDDSGMVGFFTLRVPGDSMEELRFGFVIVSPAVRGKGYGKEMLRRGIIFAREIYGAKRVTLGVFENNPSAYHCYKAVGFKEKGEEEEYEILGEKWKCIDMVYE